MNKVAIVIGHNSKSQGAERRDTGESEYKFNGRIADLMMARPRGIEFRVFRRKSGGGYAAEIDRVYREVNAWGADLSMELHFNAAGNKSAKGCETLTSGSTGSRAFAMALNTHVVAALGVKDRGLRVRKKADRGGRSLFAGRAPAILTEPFFATNIGDLEATSGKSSEKKLADAYVLGAMEALGITEPPVRPDAPITAPTPTPAPTGFWAFLQRFFGKTS